MALPHCYPPGSLWRFSPGHVSQQEVILCPWDICQFLETFLLS
jgi:hypothetical protein